MDKSYFKNCLELRRVEEGLLPLRFTDPQLAVYGRKPDWGVRSLCSSGVTIDIMTDAAWFELDFKILGRARPYHYVDVCIDNTLIAFHGSAAPVEHVRIHQDLPESHGKPRRLTIHLPYTVHIAISRFELPGGSVAEPALSRKKRLLCLGDSITQGMDAKHPSSTYATLLARFLGVEYINQGVGGYGFNADSLPVDFPFPPDLITVAYGSNDWYFNESAAEVADSCTEYMQRLVALFPKTPIVAITPIWRADMHEKRPTGTLPDAIAAITAICGRLPGVKTVAGLELMPHHADFLADRRVHPSDEGFLHMAINLVRTLKTFGLTD